MSVTKIIVDIQSSHNTFNIYINCPLEGINFNFKNDTKHCTQPNVFPVLGANIKNAPATASIGEKQHEVSITWAVLWSSFHVFVEY